MDADERGAADLSPSYPIVVERDEPPFREVQHQSSFYPPDPDETFVRRCLRHLGVELWEDDFQLLCPADGNFVSLWEVWNRRQKKREWIADADEGAHVEGRIMLVRRRLIGGR